jgi:ABC-type Fe3+-hydroxamate transport system substrate-binding protein
MVISAHVSRCAAVALAGFTALSLAGCGSSSPPSTSSSSSSKPAPTTSPTAASANPTPGAAGQGGKNGKDKAFGLVGSVSGATVTLAGPNGPATVDVAPSTRVIEVAPGQLTDVTAGECVMVRPTKDSSGAPTVTAAAVLVGLAGNGQCGGHGHGRGVTGTVASVNGNSIVLTAPDNGQTTVTVTSNTRYAKRTKADTSAIAAGQCLAARGTRDGSGTLQATAVNLRPSENGQCGGRHQGG